LTFPHTLVDRILWN
jgi:hypothetical protein